MRILLGGTCLVLGPGEAAGALRKMGTFRRLGTPAGDRLSGALRAAGLDPHLVPAYRETPAGIAVPRGLLPRVARLCRVAVEDARRALSPVDFAWRGPGAGLSLRVEQYRAAAEVCRRQGGLLVAPPGAGKTVIAMAALAEWGQPAVWLVGSERLYSQAVEQARACFDLPRGAIGGVGLAQPYNPGTHLTVAMVQTLQRYPAAAADLAARAGAVVVDEAHHAAAWGLVQLLSRFPARYRLGLTATPERADGLEALVDALFGSRTEITVAELARLGRIIIPRVVFVPTALRSPRAGPGGLARALLLDPGRNRLACAVPAAQFRAGRRTMVLTGRVAHARLLAALLRQAYGVPAAAVTGASPRSEREAVQAAAEAGRAVMVATLLADEGLDMPALDCLEVAATGRARGRTKQRAGRLFRTAVGKVSSVLYDLADMEVPSLARGAQERAAAYAEYGARIEVLGRTP